MKNPFLDAFKAPMSVAPATKFMQLLQEQQLDTVETSVKALSCRDPMALVSLQQAFMKRMVERWTKMATPEAASAATPKPAAAKPVEPAPKPAPQPKKPELVKSDTTKPVAAQAHAPAPNAWDDLTVIKGIGPKFAKTLNEHGITSYRQLASLTPAEVAALEEKLGFSGRFERENWIEQARALSAH